MYEASGFAHTGRGDRLKVLLARLEELGRAAVPEPERAGAPRRRSPEVLARLLAERGFWAPPGVQALELEDPHGRGRRADFRRLLDRRVSSPPMAEPSVKPRVSHEQVALRTRQEAIADLPDVELFSGQGGGNRFGIDGWEPALLQQFQFGDLRVETPAATIVVEVESAGGIGNLVKYWPLLADKRLPKRLVILHVFQLGSSADYIAHRRLWRFLVERMRDDLEPRGVRWGHEWEAQVFTYRAGGSAAPSLRPPDLIRDPADQCIRLLLAQVEAADGENLVGRVHRSRSTERCSHSPEEGNFPAPTLLEKKWSTPTQALGRSPSSRPVGRSTGRSQARAPGRSPEVVRFTSQPTRRRSVSSMSVRGSEESANLQAAVGVSFRASPLRGRRKSRHAARIARLREPRAPPISRAQAARVRPCCRPDAGGPRLDRASRRTRDAVSARVCKTCGRALNADHRLDRAQVAAEFGLGRAEVDRVFADLPVTAVPGRRRVRVRRADVERYLDEHTYLRGQIRRSWDAA